MLTVSPVIWAWSSFLCLKTAPENKPLKNAFLNALVFLLVAVIMDYFFFGKIRGAMEELIQPTTFYGYGFVISLPFIEIFAFKKLLAKKQTVLQTKNIWKAVATGLACLTCIVIIIIFKIEI